VRTFSDSLGPSTFARQIDIKSENSVRTLSMKTIDFDNACADTIKIVRQAGRRVVALRGIKRTCKKLSSGVKSNLPLLPGRWRVHLVHN
jgi:hypothetical protein